MMVMTDPIADMLTRIRNANQQRHESLEMPTSTAKVAIAQILKNEGYIKDFKIVGDKIKSLSITLKYGKDNERVISGIKRISKPGLRVYTGSSEVPKVLNGLGIAIISTSLGMVTDKEARAKKTGGEVVAYVW